MSAEKVAQEIYQQIQKGQALRIIDWKTRLLVFAAKLLPQRMIAALLQREIQKRAK